MADNYLEKKFEEHLNAPYKPAKAKHVPLKERRAVVTGGAKGVGAAIVRSLRVAGHKVAFCDVDEVAGRETALRTGSEFSLVDVTDVEAFRAFIRSIEAKWGGVDIIVNNVSANSLAPLLSISPELFDKAVDTGVRPIIIGAQEMVRLRQPVAEASAVRPYGRIVNICSVRHVQSAGGDCVSSAVDGAIFSVSHTLAVELAPYGITVNSISPGVIVTSDYENVSPEVHAQFPSGRAGRVEDVVRIVRFLIEDSSDFINAENIVADGGLMRKMAYNL